MKHLSRSAFQAERNPFSARLAFASRTEEVKDLQACLMFLVETTAYDCCHNAPEDPKEKVTKQFLRYVPCSLIYG